VFSSAVAGHVFTLGGWTGMGYQSLQDDLGDPITLEVGANNGIWEYGGVLQGPGSLSQVGSGATILYNASTYSGSTSISNGAIQLGDPHALPITSTLTMTGGQLKFDRYVTSGRFYIGGLAGAAGTITLQNTYAAAPEPVTLTIGENNASTAFAGLLNGSGAITKTGTGKLTLTGSNNYAAETVVSRGTLELGVNAQYPILSGGGVNICATGTLSSKVVLDDIGAPTAVMDPLMKASYHAGAWDLGKFRCSTNTPLIGLGWKVVPDEGSGEGDGPGTVVVARTYYGDFNLDGTVDGLDLDIWKGSFGMESGAVFAEGDPNYDGQVDGLDLDLWKATFGATIGEAAGGEGAPAGGAPVAGTPVPEPGTLALLLPLLIWLACAGATFFRKCGAGRG
jgi:autotransporter-associated beta strand protein